MIQESGKSGFALRFVGREVDCKESVLQSSVKSLQLELENLRKKHAELKDVVVEKDSFSGNPHVKLRKSKFEMEQGILLLLREAGSPNPFQVDVCLAEEAKARELSDEMIVTLNQLSLESDSARREEGVKINTTEQLHKEAEATRPKGSRREICF